MEDDVLPSGNVDGDINPFTGERIATIDARTWSDSSAPELYKQLTVLENRFYIAQTLGKVEIMRQMKVAIEQLKAQIQEAVKRDSKRPIRKRPNSYEPTRPNPHRANFD